MCVSHPPSLKKYYWLPYLLQIYVSYRILQVELKPLLSPPVSLPPIPEVTTVLASAFSSGARDFYTNTSFVYKHDNAPLCLVGFRYCRDCYAPCVIMQFTLFCSILRL